MPLGQTVTVVNKSGKVVKSSKILVNVFKEAQSAYRERKVEIKAVRKAEFDKKKSRQPKSKSPVHDDSSSRASSPVSRRSSRSASRRERPPIERGYSDSFWTNDEPSTTRQTQHSNLRFENGVDDRTTELVRRNTDTQLSTLARRPKSSRSASMSDIDMDLAYGELPPPLPPRRRDEETELRNQVTKLQQLLDEANCVQHSVLATIDNLQKNPDQLAAVALTLGEISTLASKMAPGALMSLRAAAPAVIALLAAPEFMIAAGVGVGVTIIAFGGYKIVKRIQKRKAGRDGAESPSEFDELQEIDADLSRVELWRRGIAEAEAESLGTSIDGEFVTPTAGRQLVSEGKLRPSDLKSTKSTKSKQKKSKNKSKSTKPPKSPTAEGGDRSIKTKLLTMGEPGGLRMLFKKDRQPELQKE